MENYYTNKHSIIKANSFEEADEKALKEDKLVVGIEIFKEDDMHGGISNVILCRDIFK